MATERGLHVQREAREWVRGATVEQLVAVGTEKLVRMLGTGFGPGAGYPFAQAEVEGIFYRVVEAAIQIGRARTLQAEDRGKEGV